VLMKSLGFWPKSDAVAAWLLLRPLRLDPSRPVERDSTSEEIICQCEDMRFVICALNPLYRVNISGGLVSRKRRDAGSVTSFWTAMLCPVSSTNVSGTYCPPMSCQPP